MAGTLVADYVRDSLGNSVSTTAMVNGLCRAWVNFNGATATVRASYNVASVTRQSAGEYTVNFAASLPDANYAVVVNGSMSPSNLWDHRFFSGDYTLFTSSAATIKVRNGSGAADNNYINAVFYR